MGERAVYLDDTYTTAWIPHNVASFITEGLVEIGYKKKDANELKEFMIDAIKYNKETTIVFSQDVAPDTVFDVHSPRPRSRLPSYYSSGQRGRIRS